MSSIGSSVRRPYIDTAALLTQVSMRPNARSAASAMVSTWCGSATSAVTVNGATAVVADLLDGVRQVVAVSRREHHRAPRCAACFAVTSPMPLDAPVITMTCSLIGSSSILMRLTPANLSLDRRRQPLSDSGGGCRTIRSVPCLWSTSHFDAPLSARQNRSVTVRTADTQIRARRPRAATSAAPDRRSAFRRRQRHQAEQRLHDSGNAVAFHNCGAFARGYAPGVTRSPRAYPPTHSGIRYSGYSSARSNSARARSCARASNPNRRSPKMIVALLHCPHGATVVAQRVVERVSGRQRSMPQPLNISGANSRPTTGHGAPRR